MSNINLVDPNKFNDNNNQDNLQMPKYEDMHIFAELTSHGKDRSVLVTNGILTKIDLKNQTYGTENKTYNLLGSNENHEFTTNWHDGSTDKSNLEGFGIESIKVTVNSSFIPQVDIKFVDYRGRTFFNNDNSPYRMLFDFPPPIFKLTIKGYYGLGLTYLLHLVKYNTEFKSDNGFFYIEANFVALTFAPLADIPFRYIIQFAMLDGQTLNPDNKKKPINTLDLILKIRALYGNLQQQIKNISSTTGLDVIAETEPNITEAFDYIHNIRLYDSIGNTDAIIFKLNEENEIELIENIQSYKQDVYENKVYGLPSTEYKKLCVGFKYNIDKRYNFNRPDFVNRLSSYREGLLSVIQNTGIDINIGEIPITSEKNDLIVKGSTVSPLIVSQNETEAAYVYLDLSKVYIKLLTQKNKNNKDRKLINNELTTAINQIVLDELGMLPTVYNIFKIILDDVDNFFDQLRNYSKEAEKHHNDIAPYSGNKNKIVNDNSFRDKLEKLPLYSFPLVINTNKNERVAPIEISEKLNTPFPELVLVEKFINSFVKTQNTINKFDQLNTKDDKGNNKWIPLSPKDSTLYLPALNNNPYYNCATMTDYLNVMVNRFYVYSDVIYRDFKSDSSIEVYAEGEANNLVNALFDNDKTVENFNANIPKWVGETNINTFYKDLNKIIPTTYNIDSNFVTLGNDNYYVDKSADGYRSGFYITEQPVTVNTPDKNSNDKFEKFLGFNKFIYSNSRRFFDNFRTDITTENLLYIHDEDDEFNTIFLEPRFKTNTAANIASNRKIALESGNKGFGDGILTSIIADTSSSNNISNRFAEAILDNKEIYTGLSDSYDDKFIKMLLLTSCFGEASGVFNGMFNKTNKLFLTPSVIQSPKFVNRYASILSYLTDEGNDSLLTTVTDFFSIGSGSTITSCGISILADLYDAKNQLTVKDNKAFILNYPYETFMREYEWLNNELNTFLSLPNNNITLLSTNLQNSKYFMPLLFKKVSFLNFDDQTFKLVNNISDKNDRKKITSLNSWITTDKTNLDKFFIKFISKLSEGIKNKKKENANTKKTLDKLSGDKDIINQTYYSLKTINDKWLTDMATQGSNSGYPFNLSGKKLIDSFAFVDRTMNPIGDTMINPEILGEMMDDPEKNVLTVLSTLLSLNHFEFFPLQNFMYDYNNNWQENYFTISNDTIIESTQMFTCMYLGGSSSYPTGIEQYGYYKDDGILDIDDPKSGLKEFTSIKNYKKGGEDYNKLKSGGNKEQVDNNEKFPWGAIKGFKVKFGEQNQSIFNEMKIDSKEYPETNESIQILSRLAGDNTNQEPAPKAQNLFNLYENRAYKATISALGNVMIQPSQYFQLENVPMFNGAYMILGVEHNIQNNRMTTSFTGTKILKYPVPRVTDALSIFGFSGGDSDNTSMGDIPDTYGNLNNGTTTNGALSDTIDNRPIPDDLVAITTDPVPSESFLKITNVTGERTLPGYNNHHKGIDIPLPIGSDIQAVADGKIDSLNFEGLNTGYGYYIVVNHGKGYFTNQNDEMYSLYAHLNSINEIKIFDTNLNAYRSLKVGDKVKAGDVIAKSGNSGHSTGSHLHFGMYQKIPIKNDYAINPQKYFNKTTKLRGLIDNYGMNK